MIIKVNVRVVVNNFAIIVALLLPHTSIISLIIAGSLPLTLFLINSKFSKLNYNKYSFIFGGVIILSFLVNAIMGADISIKSLQRLFTFITLFLLFPFVLYFKIYNWVLYFCLTYLLLSQLAYVLGINFLVQFYNTFYPYTGELQGYSSDFLLSGSGEVDFILNRRYGGIYHNPNQLIRYISLLLLVLFIENRNRSLLYKLPFLSLVFIATSIAGSRTGFFFVIIVIVFSYFYNRPKISISNAALPLFTVILTLVSAIYFLSQYELRILEVSSGLDNSIGLKIEWFLTFLNQLSSPLNFLVGHFSTDNILVYGINILDSEWGELFYNFGLLGVFTLFMFYFDLFKTKDRNLRFLLLILIWGISSTIIFSFRMSIFYMIILSNYYSYYKQRK